MTDDRISRIEQAIAEIEAAGRAWTNQNIYGKVGGSYHQLSQYLKDRRARSIETAVAVLEPQSPLPSPPAPPMPPPPTPPLPSAAPGSPLAMARTAREVTRRTEETLAEQHTAVKRQRQEIEQRLLVVEMTKSMCPPAADLARRREERTLRSEHSAVESDRLRCVVRLSQANEKRLQAADAYREIQEEAGRLLRRMRSRLRESRTLPHAWARGDAQEEAQQAAEQLARLIGDEAVAALVTDPTLQPDWLHD